MNDVVFTDFEKEKEYNETRFNPKVIYETDKVKIILGYFKAGQFIPVHKPSINLVLYIIEGKGEVIASSKKYNVKAGDLIIVPEGEDRGIKAQTNLTMLHIVSPPPTATDHKEKEKLEKNIFI